MCPSSFPPHAYAPHAFPTLPALSWNTLSRPLQCNSVHFNAQRAVCGVMTSAPTPPQHTHRTTSQHTHRTNPTHGFRTSPLKPLTPHPPATPLRSPAHTALPSRVTFMYTYTTLRRTSGQFRSQHSCNNAIGPYYMLSSHWVTLPSIPAHLSDLRPPPTCLPSAASLTIWRAFLLSVLTLML